MFHIFKKYIFKILYLFSERGGGRGKERERSINVREKHQLVASHTPLPGDLARNPGMCLERELNGRPFGSWAGTHSTEPHEPGLFHIFFLVFMN